MNINIPDHSVYDNGRGLLRVPLVILFQRFIYLYSVLPWNYTPRGCLVPLIFPADYALFQTRYGLLERNGYFQVSIQRTTVGLHALSWVYQNRRYPRRGMSIDYHQISTHYYQFIIIIFFFF